MTDAPPDPVTPLPEHVAGLPCWTGTPRGTPLLGGLSNEIWRVTDDAGAHVVRLGPDYPFHHVDRAREAAITRAAHAAGFAPEVEFTAPGVMVTAFVEGRTLNGRDIEEDPARFAALLRQFHKQMPAHVPGTATIFWVFHVIRDYARTLRAGGSRFAPGLDAHLALAARLEAFQVPQPIVFGHHDLLPANLIDSGARVWLIDYEYAAFGTPMFDLACLASNATLSSAAAMTLLASYHDAPPGPALHRAFDAMCCAALLREAMWAMISDLYLAAPGADYGSYVDTNLTALDAAIDRFQSDHGKFA